MSDVRALEESVAKAAEKVEKIKKTIAKHEAAAAKKLEVLVARGISQRSYKDDGFYDLSYEYKSMVQEFDSKLDDAKNTGRKLKDAEEILKNWTTKLDAEINKEKFVNDNAPEVIKAFLAQWKTKAYVWYIQAYAHYVEEKAALKAAKKVAEEAYLASNPNGRTWSDNFKKYMKENHKNVIELASSLASFGAVVATMDTYRNGAERLAYLEKELEAERKRKMLDLIYRVTEITGTITDAALLSISPEGNLNGIVKGEKGKADVNTIGAGGWNIQVFHFRTLVRELK